MISGTTRVFALLGRPVGHSLSPAMQNAAFRVLGLDAVYVAIDCAAERVAALMAGLAESGGGGNVTVPHKAIAAEAAGDPALAVVGACNTFWGDGGALRGANTDPDGVRHALSRLGVTTGRWLVVGTGGSARGVLAAARAAEAEIAVVSRSPERGERFLAAAGAVGVGTIAPEQCEVLINATPLGLRTDDPLPMAIDRYPAARVVLDLVYGRGGTPLTRAARRAGLVTADGREVLLGQGVAAFGCWYPDVDPPIDVMRAAIRDALG